MKGASELVLLGFVGWTLILLILMEGLRTRLVMNKSVPANGFTPDNSNLSPFMQRLARAHANCLESLPIVGVLLLAAMVTGKTAITDPLAPWLLVARLVQSVIHLASLSEMAVSARFGAFLVQIVIAAWWTVVLLLR